MKTYRIVGIGNAIADVLSPCPDAFLAEQGIAKGVMQLVERERAEVLYAAMTARVESPGGSVGNSIAGLGNLGLRTAFIGRVADDALGRGYVEALGAEGTDFPNAPVVGADLPTSRSMIFVSPDGERSMNTYLGISSEIGPDDVSEAVCADTDLLLLEGYLFDKDKGKAAFLKAAQACRAAGGRAGISLSDPFCVDRHREDFRKLVRELDYVLGNEHEWAALYETDLEAALEQAAAECPLIVCTRSGADVIIRSGGEVIEVPVQAVAPVDATGAGDQFAAGFLYGLAAGQGLHVAGRMGCVAAGAVILHLGARPQGDVAGLLRAEGLI